MTISFQRTLFALGIGILLSCALYGGLPSLMHWHGKLTRMPYWSVPFWNRFFPPTFVTGSSGSNLPRYDMAKGAIACMIASNAVVIAALVFPILTMWPGAEKQDE